MLSTLTMIHLGHIYDGLMVNLRVENAKLRKRALATIMHIAGCTEGEAARALDAANSRIKPAVLVALGIAPAAAEQLLTDADGNLRTALAKVKERERV
jgi:N-acetylmuramic acid 6-phosphate etherase